VQPFLKWAGGKRWLFTSSFIEKLPPFRRYIEPFLGGGAGFFALQPNSAIISDINSDLIELYRLLRDEPEAMGLAMSEHQEKHSKEYYYSMRAALPSDPVGRAARTLYLNRTCWNGLYRLNRKGEFNVPIGTKNSIVIPGEDFGAISRILQKAEIHAQDFEKTIECAQEGDLLFVDPPYTVKHNINGFVKYNESIFSWSDQLRLRDALDSARRRGASIIVTNADHASVKELYSDLGALSSVSRSSVISGKSTGRATITELMVVI